ncbi:hypothetical protein NDU88_002058 [Pleurodeles waltl]|uniref:Uncharacterized protein n=1 Tax=Pleurodeles waltl TaxID=8319 RepID=A0AAV7RAW1_PLEWA|nr:hypothetical protein NDU88_002058 [Pleurodeles waltl]
MESVRRGSRRPWSGGNLPRDSALSWIAAHVRRSWSSGRAAGVWDRRVQRATIEGAGGVLDQPHDPIKGSGADGNQRRTDEDASEVVLILDVLSHAGSGLRGQASGVFLE